MIDELDRAERLGIHAVVLHPGAHMGAGAGAGIDQIARSLDQIHTVLPNHQVVTLLETAAGQGSCVGCTFEELGRILALVADKARAGVCSPAGPSRGGRPRHRRVEDLVHERALAGAGDAGHADEQAEGKSTVTSLRLFSRAPTTVILRPSPRRRSAGISISRAPLR